MNREDLRLWKCENIIQKTLSKLQLQLQPTCNADSFELEIFPEIHRLARRSSDIFGRNLGLGIVYRGYDRLRRGVTRAKRKSTYLASTDLFQLLECSGQQKPYTLSFVKKNKQCIELIVRRK